MIHALIDTVQHRKILGFETGNRAQFDQRHGGDNRWVFLDVYRVKYRANFSDFLKNPTGYKLDDQDNVHRSNEPPIIVTIEIPPSIPGYVALIGSDGRYLKSPDGKFLYGYAVGYSPPPYGMRWLVDDDGFFVTDPDGAFLMERDEHAFFYLVDTSGNYITDTSGSLIVDVLN